MAVSSRGKVRLVGIMVACAASALCGLGLVFKLITPESVGHLGTPQLLGLVGLLVLPVVVVLMQRRLSGDTEADGVAEVGVAAAWADNAEAEGELREVVVMAPDLRDRSGQRHRRRAAHIAARERVPESSVTRR